MNNNLLILGAGGHGQVVKEIAESMKIFDKIDFLDDTKDNVLGHIDELEKFKDDYHYAFAAFGDHDLRIKMFKLIEEKGYIVPILIHPTAFISNNAKIGLGTVIEAKAIINTNAIVEKYCIINLATIIDHDCIIKEGTYIDTGVIVTAGVIVDKEKIESGKILIKE